MAYFRSVKRRRTSKPIRKTRTARRRPIRRRRIGRRRGGRNRGTSGIKGIFKTAEMQVPIADAAQLECLSFNYSHLADQAVLQVKGQVDPYLTIWDQVKVVRVKMQFWIKEADQFSKPGYEMPNFRYIYDPDCENRKVSWYNLGFQPGSRDLILKAGRKYSIGFSPKWATKDENNVRLYSSNEWRDTSMFGGAAAAANTQCSNGMPFATYGGPATLMHRFTYICMFRGRKQSMAYQ